MHSNPRVLAPAERAGARVHREYLIERFRVTFESGSTWFCPCAEFLATNGCSHTREAAGRRAAQARIADQLATGRSQFPANSARNRHPEQPDSLQISGARARPAAAHRPVVSAAAATDDQFPS